MDKREFLKQLEEALLRLCKSDRDDILLDYEEHFRAGAEKGMTEEDVARSLGNPADIAAQYLENLPETAKGESFKSESTQEAYTSPDVQANDVKEEASEASVGRKVANVLFWIGAIVLVAWLIYMLIGVLGTIIGCFAGAAVLSCISIFFTASYVSIFVGLILLSLGFICLAVLLIIGMRYAIKGIKLLIKLFKNTSSKILGRA